MARLSRVTVSVATMACVALLVGTAGGASSTAHIDASPVAQEMSSCPAVPLGTKNSAPAIPGGRPTVALTFDDGPGRSTAAILSILEAAHVRATFFNIGVNETARPALVQQEAADGFVLGNHTVSHPLMSNLSSGAQTSEIEGVIAIQRALTRSVPCVFRPPYGGYNDATVTIATQHHETTWMWNGSGDDWMAQGSGSAYWINRITGLSEGAWQFSNHVVLLLHNQPISMPATVAALPAIISFYKRHGYTFVDLLGRSGPPGTCGAPTVGTPPVGALRLQSGTQVPSGGYLDSPGGQYRLAVSASGLLSWSLSTGRVLWSTMGVAGSYLYMAPTGDLELVSHTGSVVWALGTTGHPGATLALRADGRLALESGSALLWAPTVAVSSLAANEPLRPGWYITSPNGRCRLTLLSTGRLALTDATGQLLWTNSTSASAPGTVTVQRDGNVVVRNRSGQPTWASWTGGHSGDSVVVTNRGTVEIIGATGRLLWRTE